MFDCGFYYKTVTIKQKDDSIDMDNMKRSADQRGTMNRFGSGYQITNALVEEVSAETNRTGYIIVSYAGRAPYNIINIELLRLNINRNTDLTDRNGRNINLPQIRSGMWIDTLFSSAMTRSIPPQTVAFRVRVKSRIEEQRPSSRTTTGQIIQIDAKNNFILTENRRDPNPRIKFVVSDRTQIFDRRGRRIPFRALSRGQWVEVVHADFMTLSIPPQTAAYRIRVL